MFLQFLILAPILTVIQAAINDACHAGGIPGVCLETSTCSSSGGIAHSGSCLDSSPANTVCCTKTCGTSGTCRFSDTCTSGNIMSGLCPGPSSFSCCLPSLNARSDSSCGPPSSVNAATIDLVIGSEGLVPRPAPDPAGFLTVGFGHKCQERGCSEVRFPFPLTEATAKELLQSDMRAAMTCVYDDINASVRLNDNQFGALVSWAFNVGCGNVRGSDLVKRLNRGENPITVASSELPQWNKSKGKVFRGLVIRRAKEVSLFKTASHIIVHPSC